jgi:hypothetical protein
MLSKDTIMIIGPYYGYIIYDLLETSLKSIFYFV